MKRRKAVMLFKRWLPYLIPWVDVLLRTTERWKRRYYAYRVRRQVRTMGDGLWIGGPTELSENTVLGDNTHFTGMKVSGNGRVEIGDNFHSGPGSKIRTKTHNYDNGTAIPYDETWIEEEVIIGDNVWLGQDVTVLPGVEIEEGAIIQAGSVVVDDIPKYAIAGGHPAEVFKYRDENHYERLKREGEFH
jgi:acetyltransferase-like isoleucine patch superfamily enzyme